MQIHKSCPECRSQILADSTSCRCGWSLKGVATRGTPTMCGFDEQGRQCGYRGVMSLGTNGESSWYCREHWDVVNGRKAQVKGNALPPKAKSPLLKAWDGYTYNGDAKRFELPKREAA